MSQCPATLMGKQLKYHLNCNFCSGFRVGFEFDTCLTLTVQSLEAQDVQQMLQLSLKIN